MPSKTKFAMDRFIPPQARPAYKIPPNVVDDTIFQNRIKQAMIVWKQVKEDGADIITWWQYLVKGGVKHMGKELKKKRMGHLNILNIQQAY